MVSCQFVLFVSVLALASAMPQLQNHYHHSSPLAHHAVPVHHHAAPVEHHHHEHHEAPAHYKFAYKVHDPHTHDIKEQEEVRDGHNVHGHYSLVEPDGTTRIVHYTADKHGFHAVVEHKGHAQHPEVHHQHQGVSGGHHHVAPVAHHAAHHQHAAPAIHHVAPIHHQAGSAGGSHHGATSHISFSSHGHGHEYHH